ncbi:MAG: helix-turn-helix transcriptional regulator [Candidatus Hydrogenedentes bacterium]|nr:helix-turn-helix transcriptional regulator [Candidatus Hydrogenedentota bacterium]
MTLGERIIQLRNRKGWSSGRLAEEAGVSRGYLWQLETGGKDRPSLNVLERLAKVLGVNVGEFTDEGTGPKPAAKPLPPGLAQFVREKSSKYGITKSDVEVLGAIHFRGKQPVAPEDWELLYLFLRKWAG